MIHPHDAIRNHALTWAGVHEPVTRMPSYEELWQTEWSPGFEKFVRQAWNTTQMRSLPEDFLRLMRARLVVGGMRYTRFGNPQKGYPFRRNIPGLLTKFALWWHTGNAEFLIDIANYAMVLYEYPEDIDHILRWDLPEDPFKSTTLLMFHVKEYTSPLRPVWSLAMMVVHCMRLFYEPEHPKHHFRAIDRNDSHHTHEVAP
jgi:hypothetical protein